MHGKTYVMLHVDIRRYIYGFVSVPIDVCCTYGYIRKERSCFEF